MQSKCTRSLNNFSLKYNDWWQWVSWLFQLRYPTKEVIDFFIFLYILRSDKQVNYKPNSANFIIEKQHCSSITDTTIVDAAVNKMK